MTTPDRPNVEEVARSCRCGNASLSHDMFEHAKRIECGKCLLSTQHFETIGEAISAWNAGNIKYTHGYWPTPEGEPHWPRSILER